MQYQHEQALDEFFVRIEPIGEDRHHRRYYHFEGDERLWVEEPLVVLGDKSMAKDEQKGKTPQTPKTPEKATAKSTADIGTVTAAGEEEQRIAAKATERLLEARPADQRTRWSVYASLTAIWKLYNALDVRGERERALKSAIKSHFELDEPPLEFLTSGHEWISRKIKRKLDGRSKVCSVYLFACFCCACLMQ